LSLTHAARVRANAEERWAEITDGKLLARVRRLIAEEHAGYVRAGDGHIEHACVEPGCSCGFGVSGPFRRPAVRCTSFETIVLPLDPNLERDYWRHLTTGEHVRARRCAWVSPSTGKRCRRETWAIGLGAMCDWHVERAGSKSSPGTPKSAPRTLDNGGPERANLGGKA